jgi:hypothetical protein
MNRQAAAPLCPAPPTPRITAGHIPKCGCRTRDELVNRLETGVASRVAEVLSKRTGTEMVDLVTHVVLQNFDNAFHKVRVRERRTFRYDLKLEQELSDLGLSKAVVRKLDALDLALHCSQAELIQLKNQIGGSGLEIDPMLDASRRLLWDEFVVFMKERLERDAADALSATAQWPGCAAYDSR